VIQPAEPEEVYLLLQDANSFDSSTEGRAIGGDNFLINRFERPFTQEEMQYLPHLDIQTVSTHVDEEWIYFSIDLHGPSPDIGGFPATYGIELDLDVDGDGDWLISVSNPTSASWTVNEVKAWNDNNDNVGDSTPLRPDPGSESDGYELLVFNAGLGNDPDAAWARVTPEEQNRIQIAVRRSLLGGDATFLWSGWAQVEDLQVHLFDYHDHVSFEEAGSPLANSDDYPLKQLAQVDSTCRMYFGFTPTGSEPGLCVVFGTVQNCTFHPMQMTPGNVLIDGQQGGTSILGNVLPGSYQFYNQNVVDNNNQNPLVHSARVRPGSLVQIVTDGNGETWACP
jgi:hypothetical protein